MKIKRVLVAYFQSSDLKSIVSRKLMYQRIIQELVEEGRAIKSQIPDRLTTFDDSSKVYLCPIAVNLKTMKVTHAYVDESIMKLDYGKKIIHDCIVPTVMQSGYIQDYEVSENWNNRLLLYKYDGVGLVDIKPFIKY
jgi:hypothetical protein